MNTDKPSAEQDPAGQPLDADELAAVEQWAQESVYGRALLAQLSTTQEMLEQAKRTIEVLSDTPAAKALAAGIDDVRSGRIRSLDCIDGGCERDKWREIARELAAALDSKHGPLPGVDCICVTCNDYRFCESATALAKARAAGLLSQP